MAYENVVVNHEEQYSIITINRPKQMNALNKQTIEELHDALTKLNADENVRAVIITGSGEKAFVAGADIKEFANFNISEGTELAARGHELLFDFVENFNKPVIAAVNGFALGGGLELAMACHIRVASYNAKLGLPETGLGLIPGYGGTQRLARLIGHGRAIEMITTAQMIDAERAHEMGLVNHLYTADELMTEAVNLVKKMLKNSPNALKSAIRSVNAGYRTGIDGYKVEIEEFGKCFGTKDFVEGTTAFLEKRKPSF
ncbi:enoyl-CoA hydratase/carnithine racemase [Owenweeksia hongkongensis DSM 17368]|uniref:Enoyl-CoA hydratase/carnithine racemase n=1 Tax=Owenweeksia hongkongensis (strain DSM 17368 / CIP 108786 / JCM 12287 / NRRL B-23963 / UST20020801) TaxID=926562 RepID=G8R6Z4_OWEHD|nr:enoyl-CoA hydratase-related protein [Owenweeksia hongkongensis]AEV33359.1 enoyl-CoA hydratase/carnithine racemase [Owenweeksia hongkongensis DSM 17368]